MGEEFIEWNTPGKPDGKLSYKKVVKYHDDNGKI